MATLLDRLRSEAHDYVTPEHLNVAPQWLGAPLARPMRRLWAIAIDGLVLALVSDLGNVWLLGAVALPIAMHLAIVQGQGRWFGAQRRAGVWVLAALLFAFGVQQAWVAQHARAAGKSVHHRHHSEDDDAAEIAAAAGVAASAIGLSAEQRSAARIAALEAQLAQAREPKHFDLQEQVSNWLDDVGLGLGWTIAYFALLPAWWNGQTLGKRLLGLRVVELTGKPMTMMRAFKRYGGYAAGVATGLFGFAQILWDSNRQAIQDKTAHTVVIDLRRAPRPGQSTAADRTLRAGESNHARET